MSLDIPQIDILLYIALSEEFNHLSDELIKGLGDGFVPQELVDIAITLFCGKVFSPVLNRDFQLAVVPAGKMGNTRAAAVTSAILAKSQTCDVVVLGIAGSLSNDLQPGDVFIPDSTNEYLANSATKGTGKTWTFETSGNHLPTSPRLLNRFQVFPRTQKTFYEKWSKECAARFAPLIEGEIQEAMTRAGLDIRPEIRLFAGDDRKLASGPAVGKGKAFVEWIKGKVDRKVAAMEMESAGVYDAVQIRTPPPRVIAIRGISDFADERKALIEDAAKDRFRAVSAKNALSLLLRGIEAGLFREDVPRSSHATGSGGDVTNGYTGPVNIHKSDIVGGDKVGGDKVGGDKIGGDNIAVTIGNVFGGSQIAIGKGIQQTTTQKQTENQEKIEPLKNGIKTLGKISGNIEAWIDAKKWLTAAKETLMQTAINKVIVPKKYLDDKRQELEQSIQRHFEWMLYCLKYGSDNITIKEFLKEQPKPPPSIRRVYREIFECVQAQIEERHNELSPEVTQVLLAFLRYLIEVYQV